MAARRGLLGHLILVAGGVVLALAIAEVSLRLLMPRPNFYIYDPKTGWAPDPGAAGIDTEEGQAWLAINQQGFRGPPVTYDKPPGTVRIAVLGDSFAEAQQVPMEDTFCAVMQRQLASCPAFKGRKIEVLDLGVDGYGTAQELIAMRRRAFRFHPDYVVLAFFAGNDVRNNSVVLEGDKCRPFFVYRSGVLELGGPFIDSEIFRLECMARFESRHLRVIDTIGSARSAIRDWWRKNEKRPGPMMGREPGVSDLVYRPPADPIWRDAWRVTDGEIAEMYHESARAGVGFLLVTLSTGIQDYPDPNVRMRYMRFLGVSDLFYPEHHLQALAEQEGFPVLNLAPLMEAWADSQHAFLHGFKAGREGTGHWNVVGNHLAGQLIADKFCQITLAERSDAERAGEFASCVKNLKLER
jgi:hypothetical protein